MSEAITIVPLDNLHDSPSNPRKRYDPVTLQELADSIRAQSLIQPIIARHKKNSLHYEIVAGHRRARACRLAGLSDVPVIIRDMSDEQVATAQLIENFQREDVTALEEAEGFRRLIDEFHVTVPELIRQTGKSRAFVYGRLKLVHLAPEARKALVEGVIDAEVAQVVARLPQAVQAEALASVTEYDAHRKVRVGVSSREAKRRLANYLTDLSEAADFPLDHMGLTDTGTACTSCVKRSGNSPDLQVELGDNTCTDRKCFEAKSVAFVQLQVDVARANGQTVLEGDDAREVQRYSAWPIDGHVRVNEEIYGGLDHGTHPVRELLTRLGEQAPAIKLLVHPDRPTEVAEIVDRQELQRALRVASGEPPEKVEPEDDDADERPDPFADLAPHEQAVLRHESWAPVRCAVIARVRSHPRSAEDLRLMLLRELDFDTDFGRSVTSAFGWDDELEQAESREALMRAKLAKLGADDMAAIMTIIAIEAQCRSHWVDPADRAADARLRLDLAARYGVDPLAVTDGETSRAPVQAPALGPDTPSPGCASGGEGEAGAGAGKPPSSVKPKPSAKGKKQKVNAGCAGGSDATDNDLVDAMKGPAK